MIEITESSFVSSERRSIFLRAATIHGFTVILQFINQKKLHYIRKMERIMKKEKSKSIVSYDEKSDVLYLGIKKGIEEEYVEIAPGVNAELDENEQVIGIEVLNASRIFKPVVRSLEAKALKVPA